LKGRAMDRGVFSAQPVLSAAWLLVLMFFAQMAPLVASAAETDKPEGAKSGGGPIHITSDRVRSNHQESWVEFIGNVKATQDDGVITADSIRMFYKPSEDGTQGINSAAVEKMIAEGNVKIVFDDSSKTAVAQKAVYTTHDKVLILSGGEPTVWSGQNMIRGDKITLFQAEDRTLVEGGGEKQVEAIFHSQGETDLLK
jgi:lipopolysaccharide export system protein LptA